MEDLSNLSTNGIREEFSIAQKLAAFRNKFETFDPIDLSVDGFIYFYYEVAFKLRAEAIRKELDNLV